MNLRLPLQVIARQHGLVVTGPQEEAEPPMELNLKPSQWGQPLMFQARPLRSRAGGRPW